MNKNTLVERAQAITKELEQRREQFKTGEIGQTFFNDYLATAQAELVEIQQDLAAVTKAGKFSGTELHGQGIPPSGPIGPTEILRPVSPYDMSADQLSSLIQAVKEGRPHQIKIEAKRVNDPVALKSNPGKWAGLFTKSAVSESGISSSFASANLPPYQTPFAVGLPFEPTRTSSLFPGFNWTKQALSWMTHTANASASTAVAELGSKPDIGEEFEETTVLPTLIAGMASASLQATWDTEEYAEANLAAWIPFELQRDLINTESNALFNATAGTDDYTFNGLLNTAGTLTREYSDSSGLTPLDTIAAGINDMRINNGAYCFPDLAITSPSTLLKLRMWKDDMGRYIWDMLSGPRGMTADGEAPTDRIENNAAPYSIVPQGEQPFAGHLWGVPVAISSFVPDGTFVLSSVKNGGGLFLQRMGLLIMYNQWAENLWSTNTQQWRAEERIAFAVQRPSAVNIITGLPS